MPFPALPLSVSPVAFPPGHLVLEVGPALSGLRPPLDVPPLDFPNPVLASPGIPAVEPSAAGSEIGHSPVEVSTRPVLGGIAELGFIGITPSGMTILSGGGSGQRKRYEQRGEIFHGGLREGCGQARAGFVPISE